MACACTTGVTGALGILLCPEGTPLRIASYALSAVLVGVGRSAVLVGLRFALVPTLVPELRLRAFTVFSLLLNLSPIKSPAKE